MVVDPAIAAVVGGVLTAAIGTPMWNRAATKRQLASQASKSDAESHVLVADAAIRIMREAVERRRASLASGVPSMFTRWAAPATGGLAAGPWGEDTVAGSAAPPAPGFSCAVAVRERPSSTPPSIPA